MDLSKLDLIIFDLDRTLVDFNGTELLPGRADFFKWLGEQPRKPKLAIASNQGGVGLRHWMSSQGWGEPTKYPTQADVISRVSTITEVIARICGQPLKVYLCFTYQSKKGEWGPTPYDGGVPPFSWLRSSRKPAPGMLQMAMVEAEASAAQTLMIGDSGEDHDAAAAAGTYFAWASAEALDKSGVQPLLGLGEVFIWGKEVG